MKHLLQTTLGIAVLAAATTVSAQVISVDLGKDTAVTGTDVTGFVPTAGWQQESGFPDFSGRALDLSDGSPSGATLDGDGSGNITTIGASTADNDYTMYNRALAIEGSGGFSTLSVTGLGAEFTGPGYDVYVYVGSATNFGLETRVTFSFTDGTTTYYLDADESIASYQGSFIQATTTTYAGSGTTPIANYVVFSGLTGTDFTISAQNVDTVTASAAGFTGMQIVAVPEPSTFAFIGTFGLIAGLVALRRRRR